MTSSTSEKLPNRLKAFFVISTLGWANALYTLWHRQSLMYGLPTGKSFCNISQTVNCDAVAVSPESAFFFGYPTSSLGLMFYCVGFFVALAIYFEKDRARAQGQGKALLWVSIVGLIPTVLLAGVSMFKLKALCLMCLAGYILNTSLVILAIMIYRSLRGGPATPMFQATRKSFVVAGLASIAIQFPLPWIFALIASSGISKNDLGLILYQHQNAPKFRFRTEGAAIWGNPNAKVQLVEFADLQCPSCAKASESLPVVLNSMRDDVYLVFKNFPLDNSCNDALDRPMHPSSCNASLAGLCVLKKAGSPAFFKYEEKVYEDYEHLSLEMIERFAFDVAGFSKEDLKTCMQTSEINDELQRQITEAKAAGVRSTPSIYVNGKILEAGSHPFVLRTVIKEYLKQ